MEQEAGLDGLVRAYVRARWGWIGLGWGAIFMYEVTRHAVDVYVGARPLSARWLLIAAATMVLWAAFTPFLLWLARRAPLVRPQRGRSAAIHLATLLTLTMLDAALQAWMWGDQNRTTFRSTVFALMVADGFSFATLIAMGHVQRANAMYCEQVRAQAALDRELTTARLRALEMQLQPHFLFNTLHAVGALVRSARPDDAVRCLATLGGLLRATLAGGEHHELALGEEIALAHRYLALQKIRFAERLQVRIDIAPDVERARVPRLILQPLLENAIRHGVEHSRTAVAIEVRARARGERLEVMVRDHGGVREAPSSGQGIGLANTRARLAALYGGDHCLELTPTEGGGLAIRIEIPRVLAPASAPVLRVLELDGELADELEAVT
jgi:two-component system, LytTR family, sensor kinase